MYLLYISNSPTHVHDGALVLMSFIFSVGSYIQNHQQDFSSAVCGSFARSMKNGTQIPHGLGSGNDQDRRKSPVLYLDKYGL